MPALPSWTGQQHPAAPISQCYSRNRQRQTNPHRVAGTAQPPGSSDNRHQQPRKCRQGAQRSHRSTSVGLACPHRAKVHHMLPGRCHSTRRATFSKQLHRRTRCQPQLLVRVKTLLRRTQTSRRGQQGCQHHRRRPQHQPECERQRCWPLLARRFHGIFGKGRGRIVRLSARRKIEFRAERRNLPHMAPPAF